VVKIYLAALFSRRAEMEQIADRLKAEGFEITARWVYGGEDGLTRTEIALLDLEDVDQADVVMSFTHPYGTATSGGGRHVEFGYALAKSKRVILIGERENVFHHHPNVATYANIEEWVRDAKPV
jgi:nucleoside 2-deoxyribosyltransferase